MTFLALLRELAYGGVALTPCDGGLDLDAPRDAVTPAILGGLREHKAALVRLLDPVALRTRFRVPPDQPIGPTLAVVMLWLVRERVAFKPADRAAYAARIGERAALGEPEYVARVLAIEDVVRRRSEAHQQPTGNAA